MKVKELIQKLRDAEARLGNVDVMFMDCELGRFVHAPVEEVTELTDMSPALYPGALVMGLPVVTLS